MIEPARQAQGRIPAWDSDKLEKTHRLKSHGSSVGDALHRARAGVGLVRVCKRPEVPAHFSLFCLHAGNELNRLVNRPRENRVT